MIEHDKGNSVISHETSEHLIVECSFTKHIWNKVLVEYKEEFSTVTIGEQYHNWGIGYAKGRTQKAVAFKLFVSEEVYAIWMERNLRNFEKRFSDGGSLCVICQSPSWDKSAAY